MKEPVALTNSSTTGVHVRTNIKPAIFAKVNIRLTIAIVLLLGTNFIFVIPIIVKTVFTNKTIAAKKYDENIFFGSIAVMILENITAIPRKRLIYAARLVNLFDFGLLSSGTSDAAGVTPGC